MEQKELLCYCQLCKKETYHTVVNRFSRPSTFDVGPNDGIEITEHYCFAICGGCHSVAMCEYNDLDMSVDNYVKVYPGVSDLVGNDEFKKFLPPKIYAIYCESITAVNAKCKMLATVGFRSTIEAICNDKLFVEDSDGQKLVNCIELLYERRIISAIDRERLHSIRLEGNDSVHEQVALSDEDLRMILDIVEHLIKSLYVFQGKNANLQKPISTFEEFEKILKRCLTEEAFQNVYTLKKLLKTNNDKRLLTSELPRFEAELRQRIQDGKIKYLSIVDDQQFKSNGIFAFE